MDLGIVAFVGVSLLSLVWTTYLDPAVTELRTLIIEPALFYLMLRTTVQYKKQLVRLIDTLLISGLAVALIGLGMYVFGEGIITAEGGTQRLAGVYGSPNNVALFLGRVVPFALCYLLIPVTPIRRWLGIATLIIGLGAIALTQSVGAVFIGVPFALAMVLILVLRQRALRPLLGMVIIGGILFVILLQFPRFGRVLDFSSGTNFFRLRVWQSAINVIGDHPLTGLGLDQFLYFFRGQYIFPDAWQEPDLSHPHNFILDFWTRLGIGGLFVFGWLQIVFWRRVVSIYRATNSSPLAQCILIGVTGAMVNLLGHGLVDNSVFVIDLAIIFVFLLAIPQVLDSDST
jgi:putative inorganic carbon (HCO3(-)) transporter